MRRKEKLTSNTLICLLPINMVFDAFLGAERLNYRHFFSPVRSVWPSPRREWR
ncbi:MAG: hypothetical protein ACRDD5_07630 [Silvania sp.]|uniref:hypothetical protein n=1 Tax=Silvania sp. TaxID=3016633 RepID=UPI003EE7D1F9